MENISAFVGHSFDVSDKEVVSIFNNYFTTLSKTDALNFSWDHAEEAQTTAISKKVKDKIVGKNLFIGIFTKKERVIKNNLLKQSFLNHKILTSDSDNFEWKTSDWVLQELGYCLGRGMSTIIMLEKGVRPISGLHADHEYIEFDRDNPSLCFEKILQQISSMSFKSSSEQAQSGESNSPAKSQSDSTSISESETRDWKTPNFDWDYFDYWIALHLSIKDQDNATEQLVYSSYVNKLGNDTSQIKLWEADSLLIKQNLLNHSAIEKIKKLIQDNPSVLELRIKLSEAYESYNSFDLAYIEAETVLNSANEFKIDYLIKSVTLLEKHKGTESARKLLRNYLDKTINNDNDKYIFLKNYGRLHKDDLPNVFFSLSEAALAIKPDDASLRFALAFRYSELNFFKLSAFHYKILVQTSPSESNWNNLGVAYENLSINTKSIHAYMQSSDMKGTLAKSNLAYKLLSVGFTDQAKELCENAMTEENYDKRVNSSLEAINEKLEADEKADALILEDTKLTRDFFISFANAIASTSTNIKSGLYKGIECNLEVKCSGNRFTAYGLYETEVNAGSLGTGLLNAAFSQNNNKIENHKISYFGEIQGNGVIAKIHRESDKKSGIFSNYNSIKDALIYYSKDEKCFYVQDLNSESSKENPYKIAYIEQLGS